MHSIAASFSRHLAKHDCRAMHRTIGLSSDHQRYNGVWLTTRLPRRRRCDRVTLGIASLRPKKELIEPKGPAIWVTGYSNVYDLEIPNQQVMHQRMLECKDAMWMPDNFKSLTLLEFTNSSFYHLRCRAKQQISFDVDVSIQLG